MAIIVTWLYWPGRNLIRPAAVCASWPINSVWRNYPPSVLEATGWSVPAE